ncbi:DMT family transporter [Candidatus Gottesmanbacteria bacterium]|nr:DMT family transporter [Candidatus Gottesmanbacteria bacterium]
MSEKFSKGIKIAFITAIISGISIFYNKLIVTKGIDSLVFNILKNGGAAILISFFLLYKKSFTKFLRLNRKDWLKLVLIAAVGGSIPFLLYFEGLRSVSAVNAGLIHKTLFIWVLAMAIPVLGEKINLWQIIGYLLIIWSNLFLGGVQGLVFGRAELMILTATLLWSLENIIAKIALKNIESDIVAWARMFFGTLLLIGFALTQNKLGLIFSIPLYQFIGIIGSILLLTLYVLTWYKSLSFAPASTVTAILVLSTPVTNILTAVFINRLSLPYQHILGMFITIAGISIISYLSKFTSKFKFTFR